MEEKSIERDELRRNVGLLIKQSREQRGWTRYELSRRSGIGEAHLMRIEQGLYSIRIDVLNKLCKALDLHIEFPRE